MNAMMAIMVYYADRILLEEVTMPLKFPIKPDTRLPKLQPIIAPMQHGSGQI